MVTPQRHKRLCGKRYHFRNRRHEHGVTQRQHTDNEQETDQEDQEHADQRANRPKLCKMPFEVLIEINNHLDFRDSHSLQQTSKLHAVVSRAHLDRVFMNDATLRHRIPQYRWPFVEGNYAPRMRDGDGGHFEQATTLQYAVYREDEVAVRRLINAGWDVNQTLRHRLDGCGRSPLGLAARLGNKRIIQMLMRAGAQVEWDMPTGYSTLMYTKNDEVVDWITEELRRLRRYC
jgi:hypothetical protein